jgi:hypothetical protein
MQVKISHYIKIFIDLEVRPSEFVTDINVISSLIMK